MKKLILLLVILSIVTFGCSKTLSKDAVPTADSKLKKENLPLTSASGTKCESFNSSINDLSICEKIDDSKEQEKVKCYYSVALSKKDASICRKLHSDWIIWDCYQCVSLIKKDISVCDDIPLKKEYRNSCYLTFAKGIGDYSVCELFDTPNEKDKCYVSVAYGTGDCDKIQKQEIKDNCYAYVSLASNDSEICSKIITPPIKDKCYLDLARAKKDATLCGNMEGFANKSRKDELQIWKDSCYNEIGSAKKDKATCDKIESEQIKGYCYRNIGLA